MTAVEWRIFDDVLISNFAKCTLHGPWHARGTAAMYPDFNPFLTKFGDNGGAYTDEELRAYFAHYAKTGLFGPGANLPAQEAWASIQPWC